MAEKYTVPSTESIHADSSSSGTLKRRIRKWDQPAYESVLSSGIGTPVIMPLGSMGSFCGTVPIHGSGLMNTLLSSSGTIPQVFQAIQQNATSAVQKLNQIQDELIAKEITINDAESSVRYKLTKRQMQDEIQICTGAVVITRGKYRPPNMVPDGEKPLYLHICAGAHLKETGERIKAVDRAAAMVEEILKQSQNNGVKVGDALNTSVFLGFDADPILNFATRIRGPNHQYINHIMNETGASVLLRGRGSGNPESPCVDGHQPLHLVLSSNNPKSLEDAKLLAENLLDTISAECGISRVSSYKVYSAVPPPQQLLAGIHNYESELSISSSPVTSFISPNIDSTLVPPISSISSFVPDSFTCQPSVTSGTSYNVYAGLYPQATHLQQVALALRHSHSPINSMDAIASAMPYVTPSSKKVKRPPQKRKFQEMPIASTDDATSDQGFWFWSQHRNGWLIQSFVYGMIQVSVAWFIVIHI